MKKSILLTLALGAFTAYANENRLAPDWQTHIQRPASGTINTVALDWRTDSATVMSVQYLNASDSPCAEYTNTIAAPLPRKYRFNAWVNITRADAAVTLGARDGEGNTLKSLLLSTRATTPGALEPGRWTLVELEADLTSATPDELVFTLMPQWDGNTAIVSDAAPHILISGAKAECTTAAGIYAWPEVHGDGSFEHPDDFPGIVRTAGAHIVDNAAWLAGGTPLTLPVNAPEKQYSLSMRAYSPVAATVSWSLADNSGSASLPAGLWTVLRFPVTTPGSSALTLAADAQWAVDNVELTPVYGPGNPHPAEQEFVVTSAEDSGEGTLRDIIAKAPDHSLVTFAVDRIILQSAIPVGSRTITIEGHNTVIEAPVGASAFTFVPALPGVALTLRGLNFTGNQNGPANGGAISASDSRATASGTIELDNVSFNDFNVSGSGGAVYINSPAIASRIVHCTFADCSAGAGAAIALNNGNSADIDACTFVRCTSRSSVGGTVSINTSADITADITACAFDACTSTATSGGAGAISVYSGTAHVTVGRCLFTACSGGRASAVSIFNNMRGTVTGYTHVVNCTAVNNTGIAPVMAMGATSRYPDPVAVFVNNAVAHNAAAALAVSAGVPSGSNNLLENTEYTLDNPISHLPDKPSFSHYIDGMPASIKGTPYMFAINPAGALYNTGTLTYTDATGANVVTGRIHQCNHTGETEISVGHTEWAAEPAGVTPVTMTENNAPYAWPSPAAETLHISGNTDRIWLTNTAGTTVYTGNTTAIDVTGLSSGIYFITMSANGKTTTQKIIIK